MRLSLPQPGVEANYAYMPVVFDERSFGATRDEVYGALMALDIHPRKYFYPLISDYECYRGRFDSAATPVAKSVAGRVLTLPMYADLELADVDWICDVIAGARR